MTDDHQDHAAGGGPHLPGALGHKVGPLPMGAWLAAIIGGLAIAYMSRRSKAAAVTPDTSGSTTGQDTSGVTIPVQDGTATYDPAAVNSGAVTQSTPITTNADWQQRAVQILVGRMYDPVSADRAIGDYLAGNPLTTVERAIVNEALIALGPPPQSPPPPPSADGPPVTVTPPPKVPGPVGPPTPPVHKPIPAPKPKPKPVQHPPTHKPTIREYTVREGDNLTEIASHLHVTLATLKRYNPTLWLRNPNRIYPGEKVRYPG